MDRQATHGMYTVSVSVSEIDGQGVLLCDGIALSVHLPEQAEKGEEKIGDGSIDGLFYAFIMGLPVESCVEVIRVTGVLCHELLALFEPVRSELHQIFLLSESKHYRHVVQLKKFALVSFRSEASLKLVAALFHNMPMPQLQDCPPILVVQLPVVRLFCPFPLPEACASLSPLLAGFVKQEDDTLLPTCSLCLRRLRLPAVATPCEAAEDILVGRSFFSNPVVGDTTRCLVCQTYWHTVSVQSQRPSPYSTTAMAVGHPPPMGDCRDCGLRENIWVCLVCGYTGCGRYTSQHAQHHSVEHRHLFALELVSGRIWNYAMDTFVHYDNSSSLYGGVLQSMLQYTDLRFEDLQPAAVVNFSASETSSAAAAMSVASSRRLARKILVAPADLQARDRLLHEALGQQAGEKMQQMTLQYEQLIEQQLQEQALYYEKLLARETLRAMEWSYLHAHSFEDRGVQDTHELDENVLRDMQDIESIKIEISAIEAEHRALLEEWRAVDEQHQRVRAENNVLLRKQKSLMAAEEELRSKTRAASESCRAQVEDLESQVADLSFYVSSREKVAASPLRDELAEGVIITGTAVEDDRGGRSRGNNSSARKKKR